MNIHSTADLLDSVLERNDKLHGSSAKKPAATTESSESVCDAMIRDRVIESCIGVFSKMCKIEIALRADGAQSSPQPVELSGVIAIAGARSITLAVKLSRHLAFAVSRNLLGMSPTEIDADVVDLVGELANMIAGSAKERLNHDHLTLGLPAVVTGEGHQIVFSKGMKTTTINFDCDAGTLQLELGMIPTC